MTPRILIATLAALTLTACASRQDAATNSGFASPTRSGVIRAGLQDTSTLKLVDAEGDGVAFQVGVDGGKGFKGLAGLVAGTDVTFRPTTGIGTYTGSYRVLALEDITLNGTLLAGRKSVDDGSITLNADFANNTLQGRSGPLRVNGRLEGRTLSGAVTYRGVNGDLRGLVGGDDAYGAFHGNNADLIYAGGFIAARNR